MVLICVGMGLSSAQKSTLFSNHWGCFPVEAWAVLFWLQSWEVCLGTMTSSCEKMDEFCSPLLHFSLGKTMQNIIYNLIIDMFFLRKKEVDHIQSINICRFFTDNVNQLGRLEILAVPCWRVTKMVPLSVGRSYRGTSATGPRKLLLEWRWNWDFSIV